MVREDEVASTPGSVRRGASSENEWLGRPPVRPGLYVPGQW